MQLRDVSNDFPVFALFSGGHDSLCSTHLAMTDGTAQEVVHIHTGIGIPETREYVHEMCSEHGWPLTELRAPEGEYERLVLERGGFPYGVKGHHSFYYYLKQKQLRAFVREQGGEVGLVTGIRRSESGRRMNSSISIPVRREGRKTWLSPILDWTALDCSRYIDAQGLRRNPVVDLCHRSGECLCGALSRASELQEIGLFYPEVVERIRALERKCEERGIVASVWAGKVARKLDAGQQSLFRTSEFVPLCSSCTSAADEYDREDTAHPEPTGTSAKLADTPDIGTRQRMSSQFKSEV